MTNESDTGERTNPWDEVVSRIEELREKLEELAKKQARLAELNEAIVALVSKRTRMGGSSV